MILHHNPMGIAIGTLLFGVFAATAESVSDNQIPTTSVPRLGAGITVPGFPQQLAVAQGAALTPWTATTTVTAHTANSVSLLYEANLPGSNPVALDDRLLGLFSSSTIGIPPFAEVEVKVVEAKVHSEHQLVGAEERFAGIVNGPVTVRERGELRRQEVVTLGLGPQVEDDRVIVYERIEVEVLFSSNSVPKWRGRSDRWGEELYRHTLLNYRQSKHWRHAPQISAAKVAQEMLLSDNVLKVTVRSNGLYKITGAEMESAGIDLDAIDPERIRMWYGGGWILGLARRVPRGFDRREISIVVEDGGDGRFGTDDFVLFYGEATQRWDYNRKKSRYFWRPNPYTEDNVFFLDTSSDAVGLRVKERSGSRDHGNPRIANSYRERVHLEDDQFILVQLYGIKSGYDWYWEDFGGNARNFSVIVRDAVPDTPVDIRVRFWGWSKQEHSFSIYWNEQLVQSTSFDGAAIDTLVLQAPQGPKEGLNQLGLFHRDNSATRLDWIQLEYNRGLSAQGGDLSFSWPPTIMPEEDDDGVTAEFVLTGFPGDERPRIFEVSVLTGMREIVDFDFDHETGVATFQAWFGGEGVPPQYVAALPSRWKRPAKIVRDVPSRLRTADNGADYIVVTHPDFLDAAERLAAWRGTDDRFGEPMRTMAINVTDVYDEFSGGLVDPMAIRSFVSYAVNNWNPAPYFICLMGDGTYDYKNNAGTSHPNWIPPYQDGKSMYDEWYVRVAGGDVLPDLAIGRLPVQSAIEANGVVDKLIGYDNDPEVGPWQVRMLLVSDDLLNPQKPKENESFFILDAESMAQDFIPDDLDLIKLYIGQFPLEGRTKPQARNEFVRRFNEGALILTYLGHGNPDVLAHEQMFVLSRDAGLIDNGKRLPFMYTAASQVGVFDEPDKQSMPEALMNRPDGGVIGFISATRVGFHISNMFLAREFHRLMYRTDAEHVPVGHALLAAKQNVTASSEDRVNIQRYSLIGDPALRIARPRFSVDLDVPESVQALEEVQLSGYVLDADGQRATAYTGTALVQAFDSTTRSRLEDISYFRVGVPIYRGLVEVENGRFETAFRVPKDISYKEDNGRVSAYVWSDYDPAAFGATSGVELAGTAPDVSPDETGPEITIGFQGQSRFTSGDFVPPEPVLAAVISDPNGMNITGETGHEMDLRIDDRFFTVTELFNSTGDYRTGLLEFPLPDLEPGTHTLRLKAWDTFNNSTRVEATFQVADADAEVMSGLLFYPNPMRDRGNFTYTLTVPVESVRISVFSITGNLVDKIVGTGSPGFNQVPWTPPVDLANGTYLYTVELGLEAGGSVKTKSTIQVMN